MQAASYTHQLLRVVVAQICQTIGWQSVTATSLEIMIDILDRYIREVCRVTHDYAEHYNRTEANLDDLEMAFRDMGINMSEIIEYVSYVDPIAVNLEIPKYPVTKDSHFNFLKPGSKEVLTRPVHIHEHLPPINPQEEEQAYANGEKDIDVVGLPTSSEDVFKRPADTDANAPKKIIKLEEEGRATREISSVMMTTSGFISPAREGKLPESKPPKLQDEFPKPTPPPMISPAAAMYKPQKDQFGSGGLNIADKKLEKKLKKKNHDKEKKKDKDKQHKEKYSLPDPSELAQYDPVHPQPPIIQQPPIIPREANEQMIMAERKKELKKLKMKNKEETKKTKKEKPPKHPKNQSFDQGFLDTKSIIDPYQVLPTTIAQPPPATSSQIQAHKYLTGAAHGLFSNNIFDQNTFGSQQSPLLSAQHPLIEGKLVSEPDKQKLNIFKKISKPKEDSIKHHHQQSTISPQMDLLTPSKLDRFDQTSHQQQSFSDHHNSSIKKMHKLPKETTLTRVNDESLNMPMNLSGISRSNESSFEDMISVPKTPTIPPRTPDFKIQSVEKKEKKERKKKEKKVDNQPDWMQQSQQQQHQQFSNLFDLSAQNNSFLQNLQTGSLMGNLANSFMINRNPFSLPATDIFSPSPGLIPRTTFGMSQSMNPMMNSYGMDINNLFQQQTPSPTTMPSAKPKKVKPKPPKQPAKSAIDEFLSLGSKFCNVAPLVPPSIIKDRYDTSLMNLETFPLQQQNMNTAFDQLLKDQHNQPQQQSTPAKKFPIEKVETFDLTKDSSPEPTMTAPMPSTSSTSSNIQHSSSRQDSNISTVAPTTPSISQQESVLPTILEHSEQQQQLPVVKEKSKEKKKKKDKDREKERDKDKEERKKKKKEKKKKKDKHKEKHRASMSTLDSQSNDTEDTADNNSTSSVPKLMLKLNSPRPNTPDTIPTKKTIIQRTRNEDFEFPSPSSQDVSHRDEAHSSGYIRDPSPELARISPLVTRPPKIKPSTSIYSSTGDYYHHPPQSSYINQQISYDYNTQYMDYVQQNATYTSGSYSNIQHMHHQQLHQQDYNQPAQTSTHSYQSQPQTQYSTQNYQQQNYAQPQQNQQEYGYNNNSQTWNISQNKASYIKDDEKIGKASSNDDSPGAVKEGKVKQLPESSTKNVDLTSTPKASLKTENFKRKLDTEKIVDADGSTVWICPACGSIDDGSPMIGCDSCDAWYHWACVGIKVEPNENEDWFCRACISRKQSGQLEGKKKKRKKKDKESKNL